MKHVIKFQYLENNKTTTKYMLNTIFQSWISRLPEHQIWCGKKPIHLYWSKEAPCKFLWKLEKRGGSQKVSVYIGSASQKIFFDCERFALTQFFGEGRVLASRPHYYRGAMILSLSRKTYVFVEYVTIFVGAPRALYAYKISYYCQLTLTRQSEMSYRML